MKKRDHAEFDNCIGKGSFVFLLILTALFFVGCGSKQMQEMALSPDDDAASLRGNHISLLTIRTDNQFKPSWPPEVYGLEITDERTNEKMQIAVHSLSKMSLIKKALNELKEINEKSSSWEGLISFHLPPGRYRLTGIRGGCTRSAGIVVGMASFDFPFNIPFQVDSEQYIYLGRIEMVNRERVSDDEIPSGNNVATRLPQKQSGFGTGTFDVKIYDNFDQDIQRFRNKYPVLINQQIAKKILPPWKKPENM